MILLLFTAHEILLISDIFRFIFSTKWRVPAEYLILQTQRKSCLNIFLQWNKGNLSLKPLVNLGTRHHIAEPDFCNPISPLTFSHTDCCMSLIISILTVLTYLLLIVKPLTTKTEIEIESNLDQLFWKYFRFGDRYRSLYLWEYEWNKLY